MITRIYYSNNPHPLNSKEWSKIYKNIMYDENNKTINMKKWFFNKYYKKLPFELNISDKEKIFVLFNTEKNPLSSIAGQRWLKEKKVKHTSMMVGDIIKQGKQYYIVSNIGFKKINIKN